MIKSKKTFDDVNTSSSSILSIIAIVLCSLICISFIYAVFKSATTLNSNNSSYIFKQLVIDSIQIGAIMLLTINAIKNPEMNYIKEAIIAAVISAILVACIFIYFEAFKYIFSLMYLEIVIASVLILYTAYFVSKAFTNSFINRYEVFSRTIVTACIIILMYDKVSETYLTVVKKIIISAILQSLT